MQELVECRRVRTDRRQAVWRSFAYSLVMNRRAGDRRAEHQDTPAYVDIYGPKIFTGALLLILLSVLDAFFTLELIKHGSSELNPFLAMMLEKDVMWFFATKYLITAFSVFWLVTHKKFTFFGIKGRHLLLFAVAMYGILVTYQLSMLIQLP